MARSPRLLSHGRLVLLLGALSAFGPLSMDMYLPGLPSMASDLSAPAWAAQLTITTSMLGLAGGQLVAGPISDALGRRRPLLAGVAAYAAASVLCAAAPTIWLLLAFRLVQGLAGAAGIVIARAIVRDLHEGIEAARMFAMLVLVGGLAPILAPLIGGELLHVTDWRGIFVVLAGIGALLLLGAWAMLGETLAPENRHRGGPVSTLHVFRRLVRDGPLMGYTLSAGLTFGAMATYTSGSPFVLQDIHGVSPQLFSVIFASNAIGIMAASQISRAVVGRYGPRAMLGAGVRMGAAGGLGVLVSVVADLGLAGLLPSLFVMVSSVGIVLPNSAALALADHPRTAGSASALLGLTQFATGALAAPLAGVGGSHTALPMAIVVATLPLAGLACLRLLAGPSGPRPVPLDARLAMAGQQRALCLHVAGQRGDAALGVGVGQREDGAGGAERAGQRQVGRRADVERSVVGAELGHQPPCIARGVLDPGDRQLGENLDRDARRRDRREVVGQHREVAGVGRERLVVRAHVVGVRGRQREHGRGAGIGRGADEPRGALVVQVPAADEPRRAPVEGVGGGRAQL